MYLLAVYFFSTVSQVFSPIVDIKFPFKIPFYGPFPLPLIFIFSFLIYWNWNKKINQNPKAKIKSKYRRFSTIILVLTLFSNFILFRFIDGLGFYIIIINIVAFIAILTLELLKLKPLQLNFSDRLLSSIAITIVIIFIYALFHAFDYQYEYSLKGSEISLQRIFSSFTGVPYSLVLAYSIGLVVFSLFTFFLAIVIKAKAKEFDVIDR